MTGSEKCWRRIAPDFKDPCPNNATGGITLVLFPHQHIQKRYGHRPMLRVILDLPVCAECFPKMTARQVIADGLLPGQWGVLSKAAQRRNNGILPVNEESAIEHISFSNPEYAALRAHIAKEREKANDEDSQPALAAPERSLEA